MRQPIRLLFVVKFRFLFIAANPQPGSRSGGNFPPAFRVEVRLFRR